MAAAIVEFSSVLDATAWGRRRDPFGELQRFDDGRPIVVMELAPEEPPRAEEWTELARRWLELLPHHHILDAIEDRSTSLLLRYAAIDWKAAAVWGDQPRGRQMAATWGRELVDAYISIASQIGEAAYFMRPLVLFDVASRVRLGFLPTTKRDPWIPRDVMLTWPKADEAGLQFAVATAIGEFCHGWNQEASEPLRSALTRATDPSPRYRYPSLASLRAVLDEIASAPLDVAKEAALVAAEEGIGWLLVDEPRLASPQFLGALKLCPDLLAAKEGLARCHALRRLGEVMLRGEVAPPPTTMVQNQEDAGQYLAAAYRYECAAKESSRPIAELVAANVGVARCRLALGHVDAALSAAIRTLELDPRHVEALAIASRTAMLLHQHTAALDFTRRHVEINAADAGAHYQHGRALLLCKRFHEARDAFDRACLLEPKRIEAMLLRREADRIVRRIAGAVGVARPMTIDLPEHLMELRDPVAAGRVDEVIPKLQLLVEDPAAQLVLAECLAYAQRYDEALVVYQRAGELDAALRTRATIGRARALIFLERAAEALAELAGFEGREANELRAMIRERLS